MVLNAEKRYKLILYILQEHPYYQAVLSKLKEEFFDPDYFIFDCPHHGLLASLLQIRVSKTSFGAAPAHINKFYILEERKKYAARSGSHSHNVYVQVCPAM